MDKNTILRKDGSIIVPIPLKTNTFVKVKTIKDNKLNYYIPEKWEY